MVIRGAKKGIFERVFALLLTFALCMGGLRADAFAQIASEDALYDSVWNYLFEDSMVNNGVVQSICATPDYLITIENTSNDTTQPDTVSAYYKNPFDKDGNPVPIAQTGTKMQNIGQLTIYKDGHLEENLIDLVPESSGLPEESVTRKNMERYVDPDMKAFIDEIRAMNRRMQIPTGFDFIQEKDIPQMITWALAEANPVYPVPVVYDRKRCEKVIRRIISEA